MTDREQTRLEAEALHAALEVVRPEHYGWCHGGIDTTDATYKPGSCPGCAYSILRRMFQERS